MPTEYNSPFPKRWKNPHFYRILGKTATAIGTDSARLITETDLEERGDKLAVRLVTTVALSTYTVSSEDLTITCDSNEALSIDGVDLVEGDRFLLTKGAAGADNGIYEVTDPGSGSTPWVAVRASDANTDDKVTPGLLVFVSEGATKHDTWWQLVTNATVDLGTTSLSFAELDSTADVDRYIACARWKGTRTVTQVNGLSPKLGDGVTVSDSGTPSATGSTAATAGSIIEYQGATLGWRTVAAGSGGFVPAGTLVIVANDTLYGPLTDVTDRKKIAEFNGVSNTPSLLSPTSGERHLVSSASIFNGNTQVYDVVASLWVFPPSTVFAFAGRPDANADVTRGFSIGCTWLNTTYNERYTCTDATATAAHWKAHGWEVRYDYDADDDLVTNASANTDTAHALAVDIGADVPEGTVIEAWSLHSAVSTNSTDTWRPKIKVGGIVVADVAAFDADNNDIVSLYGRATVSVAGTSGALNVNDGYARKVASSTASLDAATTVPSVDNSVNFGSAHTVQFTERWSAQSASNSVALRNVRVRVTSPDV